MLTSQGNINIPNEPSWLPLVLEQNNFGQWTGIVMDSTLWYPKWSLFFSVIWYGIEPATFLFVNLVANDLVLFCKEHGTKPPTVVTPQPQ